MTFIDEFTRFTVVVPIARKSDVATEFNKFRVWFERRYECIVKCLHSDGGGEYEALVGYCDSVGIELDMTPAASPELNGMAERMNRTLVESALAMFSHANMPKAFWAEAVAHAADIRNRFIAPRCNSKTSYELLTGETPRLDHLRVFGSLAWTHVPKKNRIKLDDRSLRGVVVACYDNSLYKLWIPSKKRAVLSRHVQILENKFPPIDWYSMEEDSASDTEVQTLAIHSACATQLPSSPPVEVSPPKPAINFHDLDWNEDLDVVTHITPVASKHGAVENDEDSALPDGNQDVQEEENENQLMEGLLEAPPSRYPQRVRTLTQFYNPSSANLAVTDNEPNSIAETLNSTEASEWQKAIDDELQSLNKHHTWDVCSHPEGELALDTRFEFRRKWLVDGTVGKYKARLVVKGFLQGNIEQTYSPVVDFSTVPAALAVAVQKDLRVHQLDVRTAFLHGKIDSDVYIRPPRGAGIKLDSNQSLKLNKGLYGLKQAPRLWFEKWESVVCSLGFKKLSGDQCFIEDRIFGFYCTLTMYY